VQSLGEKAEETLEKTGQITREDLELSWTGEWMEVEAIDVQF